MTVLNDIQITKNFKLSEFMCHDGNDEVMLNMDLAYRLQALRTLLGHPIIVAAGYRSPTWNEKVGGSPNSKHMKGEAGDIKVPGITPKKVAQAAIACGFRGIGVYTHNGDYFVHLDVRTGPTSYWKDNAGTHNLTAVKDIASI